MKIGNYRLLLVGTTVAIATMVVSMWLTADRDEYATASPSITQGFISVPSEQSLVDLCTKLRYVHGVTGVGYRDFSNTEHTATITVFYDPSLTSVRQLRVFIQHAHILWIGPSAT